MKFGVHVSIAGGLEKGLERAVQLGCDTAQMFLVNPRGWKASTLEDEAVERFLEVRKTVAKHVSPLVVHIPYLPNLSALDDEIYQKSIVTLRDNLERCERLKIDFLVTHMGKGVGKEGVDRMLEGILRAYNEKQYPTCLLLENAAGQGKEMGHKIPEIAELYAQIPEWISKGICFDTCHGFAAGYDVSSKDGIKNLIQEYNETIGFKEVKVIHLNDAMKPLGSRVDRHAKIGEGEIGRDGFKALFSFKEIQKLPCIMEVPRKTDEDDINQLKLVRSLVPK